MERQAGFLGRCLGSAFFYLIEFWGIFGGFGLHAGGSLLNVGVYNDYLTKGLTIEGQIREDMLDAWFGSSSSNTRDIGFTNDIVPFGFFINGIIKCSSCFDDL